MDKRKMQNYLDYISYFPNHPELNELSVQERQELYSEYIDRGGFIGKVPENFRTKEMLKIYIKKNIKRKYFFRNTPEVYLVPSIINLFAKVNAGNPESLEWIPDEYLTEEICLLYFEQNHDIKIIPEKYITQEMVEQDYQSHQDITRIPKQYITQEMVEQDYQTYQDITRIPAECVTQEIIDNEFQLNPDFFANINQEYQIEIVKKELYVMARDGGKLENILQKYQIKSRGIIEKALEEIAKENPEQYSLIKDRLKRNHDVWIHAMMGSIMTMKQIIDCLGPTDWRKGLTTNQKIQFTYLVHKSNINFSFSDIYQFAKRESTSQEFLPVVSFLEDYLGYRLRELKQHGGIKMYEEEVYTANHGADWIKKYDLDNEFSDSKEGKPIKLKYHTQSGDILELDKETAQEVIEQLKSNNIPDRNCVVKEAFRQYMDGKFEAFISSITAEQHSTSRSHK